MTSKKMEDDHNFKAVLLSWFNNKNLKNKGFDTIEIDLVCCIITPSLVTKHKSNIAIVQTVFLTSRFCPERMFKYYQYAVEKW